MPERQKRIMAALCGLTLGVAASSQPAGAWQAVPGGRWSALQVPSAGKTGFSMLPAEQTGVRFTNTLDEWQGASNRVLFNGSGLATGDFDQDGLPDIFFCSLNGANTLYKNQGGFRFEDVTAQSGLPRDKLFYRGAVFADINGDQSLDLLICVVGGGVQCWINDGKGRFSDATSSARTGSRFASTTLALADVDGNGSLDLYVANNRTEDIRDRGQVNLRMVDGKMKIPPELQDRLVVIDGQLQEYGEPDQLLMNNGQGRFTPVSWTGGRFRDEAGLPLRQPPLDWGLAATFRDVNSDGAPDLYVCNDFWTPDRFWLNDGKGRFRAAPPLAMRSMSASSMGVDFADIDRDGDFDFFVVDMLSRDPRLRKRQKLAQMPMPSPIGAIEDRPQIMRNTLFLNRGDGTFAEIANYAGVAASDWSWSPLFVDVDLDGYEDVLIGAGHMKDVQDLDALVQIRARQHSWSGFTNEVERQKAFTQELMEHMRLYPPLEMPIIAFRNRHDLRFEEVTSQWGTAQPGVHHAIAMADFDADGDLDMAVNNLGAVAGIYRNESPAPRVAVRLQGLSNVQGIGARVTLHGGVVPKQSQEVVCGGRYMAGSEPLLVFGAGTNAMSIEVLWRSGKTSLITNVMANRSYVIEEAQASDRPRVTRPSELGGTVALFEDVSQLLNHTHRESPFDDFALQPMLPRRLSQLGPGVAWVDVDADGHEDLAIGSGRGGQLACYRNTGTATFQRITGASLDKPTAADQTTILGWVHTNNSPRLLVGLARYEAPSAAPEVEVIGPRDVTALFSNAPSPASIGPLALADIEGDGDLDLIVASRMTPGRYPEAAPSRLFRFESGNLLLDATNTAAIASVGIVSGAVWSDLSGDGFPELILACEWGPIKIFRNERGRLSQWNPAIVPDSSFGEAMVNLEHFTGWWNGVSTGDLDGDGRLDIVAANWGLNSDYAASARHPLELYYADVDERGVNDLIETEWESRSKQLITRRGLDAIGRHLPVMTERFRTHRAFSEASIDVALGPDRARWRKVSVATLASTVFLNRGDHFLATPLPAPAQFSPAFAVNIADFDGDGNEDVFLSQNFFANAPETPRLDAGRGLLLQGDGAGRLNPLSATESGLAVYGDQRGAATADFDRDGRMDLVVTQNGATTKLYRNRSAKPGLRVRLFGPRLNPRGIGATLRIGTNSGDRTLGPAREIHAGSGYWSQDSAVQVLSLRSVTAGTVHVRWPGGEISTIPVPPGVSEISVTNLVATH